VNSSSVWARTVPWARGTLERELGPSATRSVVDGGSLPSEFEEKRGAFVTLKRHPSGDLRGCIGYPLPILPLRLAVARAAVAAATEDPRFPPVASEELPWLTVEVSVLTVPEPVPGSRPADRLAEVTVGRDGLIVEGYGTSGLLLPQVGPEQGWDARELLEGTCEKAGLPPDAWRDPRVRVLRFRADVFAEASPRGEVVQVGRPG
jgi:uncharacterized protein